MHWSCVYNVCECSCAPLSGYAGLHTEVGQMVREKWRSMLASCCHGTSYVPDKRLGQLLQQWGGDDEEGVGQAEKEGGERERRLKVLGEDLTAEELKEVLQVSCVTHFQTMLFPCYASYVKPCSTATMLSTTALGHLASCLIDHEAISKGCQALRLPQAVLRQHHSSNLLLHCSVMHECSLTWQKLQACLRDSHPSGQAEEKRRGGLIGCFRPRRHSKLASEEELDKAAQYVVARFGAYDNEDEDEEEEEGAEELEGKVSHQKLLR